ncbi:MAG: gas vesicle protein GvpG [Deltaproteobacteria bacterium GWA2_54_12]|nr:MAG: gas vesicle protein GvpG [Deltaproteobacteria bacterium GWA2_54_12]
MPVNGLVWVADKLKDSAEAEFLDESRVQESLLALQMRLEMDEISEREYMEQETELLKRLEDIRKYKEQKNSG